MSMGITPGDFPGFPENLAVIAIEETEALVAETLPLYEELSNNAKTLIKSAARRHIKSLLVEATFVGEESIGPFRIKVQESKESEFLSKIRVLGGAPALGIGSIVIVRHSEFDSRRCFDCDGYSFDSTGDCTRCG